MQQPLNQAKLQAVEQLGQENIQGLYRYKIKEINEILLIILKSY